MNKPEEFIERLSALANVGLPEDPSEAGFGKVNQALAAIQNNNTEATRIIVQAIADKAVARREYTTQKKAFDFKRDELLATDEEVKKGKNAGEREALAAQKMTHTAEVTSAAEQAYRDTEAIVTMADHTLAMLKMAKELTGHMLGVADKEIQLGLINRDNVQ